MTAGEPLACSLTGGELRRREADLRALLGDGAPLSARREGGGTLRVELRASAGLRERLERAAELERACCPFLDLTVEDAGERIVFRICGPPEATAVIDDFEALVTDADSP